IDLGVETDIIEKSGAWFSYGDKRLGQCRENAKLTLKENPELAAESEARVREQLGLRGVAAASADDVDVCQRLARPGYRAPPGPFETPSQADDHDRVVGHDSETARRAGRRHLRHLASCSRNYSPSALSARLRAVTLFADLAQ